MAVRSRVEIIATRRGKALLNYDSENTPRIIGGDVLTHETEPQAAARIFKEKTGYDVVNLTVLPIPPEELTTDTGESLKVYFFSAELSGPRAAPENPDSEGPGELRSARLAAKRLDEGSTDPVDYARAEALRAAEASSKFKSSGVSYLESYFEFLRRR